MGLSLGEVSVDITGNTNQLQTSFNEARRLGNSFSRGLSNSMNSSIGGGFNNIGTAIGGFATSMGNTMSSVGSQVKNLGGTLTKSITLPIAAAGVAIFKLGKDFEREMSHITGLVGISKEQVDKWGQEIIDMAPQLGQAPIELAAGLYDVTSSGIKAGEAMAVLKESAKAATAGLGTTKDVANLVTSAMNAYGPKVMNAGKATDILTAAVKEGKADAPEFASALGQVLPIASTMGVQFEEVAGSVAVLTLNGLDCAESTTQLKAIMSGLIKPSKGAEDALGAMGTSSAKLRKQIKEEGLLSTLDELNRLTKKYGDDALADVFPNIRAFTGALGLANLNVDKNKAVIESVTNSTGDLNAAFKAATDTVDFRWDKAIASAKATAISFFNILKDAFIPILEGVAKVFTFVSDKFKKMSPQMQKGALLIIGALGGVGPILTILGTGIVFVGGVIAALGGIISALGTAIAVVGLPGLVAIIAALPLIAAYVGVVVGAIGAFIGSLVYLYKNNSKFRENVLNTWNTIKKAAIEIWGEIKLTIQTIMDWIKEFWKNHGDTILKYAGIAWNAILAVIRTVVFYIKNYIKLVLDIIRGDWSSAWDTMKIIVKRGLDIYAKLFETFKKVATKIWLEIVDSIKSKLIEFKDNAIKYFNEAIDYIVGSFYSLKDKIAASLVKVYDKFIEWFVTTKDAIKLKLEEWWTTFKAWFAAMPERIKTALIEWKIALEEWAKKQNEDNKKQLEIWKTSIINWYTTTKENIKIKLAEWAESLKAWFISIPDKIKAWFETWKASIVTWFTTTKESIKLKLVEWWGIIKEWFITAPGKIKAFLANWWETIKTWFTEAKAKLKLKLDEWWTTIKGWFNAVPNKPEIKNAGKNLVNKMTDGTKEKKKEFTDKLGKLIIDVATAAVIAAGIALLAAGKELVNRIIKGVKSVSLKEAGQKIVDSLIDGLMSRWDKLGNSCKEIAAKIRGYFPFSPAKEGPLSDLDKLNFEGMIVKALERAKSAISKPSISIGQELLSGIGSATNTSGLSGMANRSIVLSGPFNFYGVQDTYGLMKELKSTVQKYTGRIE
jgi:TP901 family phage tail tape measure protein